MALPEASSRQWLPSQSPGASKISRRTYTSQGRVSLSKWPFWEVWLPFCETKQCTDPATERGQSQSCSSKWQRDNGQTPQLQAAVENSDNGTAPGGSAAAILLIWQVRDLCAYKPPIYYTHAQFDSRVNGRSEMCVCMCVCCLLFEIVSPGNGLADYLVLN